MATGEVGIWWRNNSNGIYLNQRCVDHFQFNEWRSARDISVTQLGV